MENLLELLSYGQTALVLMVVLTVLVAVHELGHFWVARALGMDVDAFAVMMGGRRVTDLSWRLDRPLVSAWVVILCGLISVAGLVIGAAFHINWLYLAGLASVAVALPLWTASRLQALYRLPNWGAYRILGIAWAIAGGYYLVTTPAAKFAANQFLGLLFFASLIATLITYYQPVLQKPEDSKLGDGLLRDDQGGEVSVQFRPLLARKDRHGTEFSLLALPLGGFAAIKGMHPKDDGSEVDIPRGFFNRPAWARWLVLAAGPAFSLAFGILLLTVMFVTVGVQKPNEAAIIGNLVPDGPAGKAGIQPGDRVISIDGEPTPKFFDVLKKVRSSEGRPLEFLIGRGSITKKVIVHPKVDTEPSPVISESLDLTEERKIQAKMQATWQTERKPLAFSEAFPTALMYPIDTVKGLVQVAMHPSRAKDEIAGTAGIAQMTHRASEEGIATVLVLAAMLSVSLGVMNLLPFHPLDGGQMVVAFVEVLRGNRRLPMPVQQLVSTVGVVFVFALVALVMLMDANRLLGR